nr:YadA-like family protein [Phyllobacterium sp. P30BS-XVII]
MSLALGKSANAIDGYSVAIGASAQATAKVATAIGNNSQASGEYSFAIGYSAEARATMATAIGNNSQASGEYSFAIGSSAQAAATRATAIGVGSEASGEYSFAAGDFAKATALNSTAVGGAEATRIEAIGIGQLAKALAQKSIAIGSYAKALDDFAIAHGRLAIASGGGAIALGAQAQATGTNATAIGGSNNGENHVLANAPGSTAIGASAADIGARAQGVDSVAIGGGAKVLASTKSDQDVIKAFNDAGLALNTAKVEANKTEVNKEQAKLRFDSASAHHKEVMNRLATAKEEVSAAQENRDAARKEYDQGKSKCKKVCLTKAEKALADARNKLTRLEKSNADDIKSAAKAEADAKNELDAAYADLDTTKVDNKVQKNLEELQQKFNTAKAALDAIKTISGGVAIGLNAEANPDAATAIGKGAQALAAHAIAIGLGSKASSVDGIAMGSNAVSGVMGTNVTIGKDAKANAFTKEGGAVAIGLGQKAIGNGAVAIGDPNTAIGTGAVALGANNMAAGKADKPSDTDVAEGAVAIGSNNKAIGQSAIAMGLGSQALGLASLALGKSANAMEFRTIAIGEAANAGGIGSIAFGVTANAAYYNDMAFGYQAEARGDANGKAPGTAFGHTAKATGRASIAFGTISKADAYVALAIGYSAEARATMATAIGVKSEASGHESFAAGGYARATARNSIAVGGAEATQHGAIGIGEAAKASAQKSIAIGLGAETRGDFAIAHGRQAIASGEGAIALGAQAQATGTSATAIGGSNNGGNHVLANAPGSTAIGASAADIGARAQGVDSVAIGGGAKVLVSAKSDQDVIKAFNDAGLALNTAKAAANNKRAEAEARFTLVSDYHKEVTDRIATVTLERDAAIKTRDAAKTKFDQDKSETNKQSLEAAEKALADAVIKLGSVEKTNAEDIKAAAKAEADAKNELDAANADLDTTKVDNKVQKNLKELQQKFNTAKAALDAIKTISGGVAIGLNAEANPDAATAMGKDAKASADRSVALGSNATANNVGDVALGAGSETAAVVNTADIKISGKNYTFAGAKAKSTVSIGMRDAERTITNVAAGRITSASTDGINGSQLFATNQAIEALNDSSVKYDDQQKSRITLGATGGSGAPSGGVTVTNLAVGKVSKDSKDAVNGGQLYAASAEFASSLGGGATVDPATGQVTKPLYLADKTGAGKKGYSTVGDALTAVHEMAGKGFDVAVKAVSGTASGGKVTVKPGDTVTYAAGDNIALTQTGNTIALATSLTPVFGTVTVGKNGADGALSTLGPDGLRITAKGADGKTTDGPSILASGIDAGGRTIAHVAAGKAETDAANLGQMKDAVAAAANPLGSSVNNLGGSVAGMLGGGSTFDPKTGKLSEPAFMVHDTRYNNVSGAITALDGGISNLMKDALQWNPAIGAYDASHGGSGPQRITNVANGSEANDAVNLSQLNEKISASVSGSNVNDLAGSLASTLGGAAKVDPKTGKISSFEQKIRGISDKGVVGSATPHNTVAKALAALDENTANLAGIGVKYDDQQKSRITLGATGGSGAPSGGVTVTNLAVGKVSKDSKDAVNGGQLYAASAEFASSLGGGATVDPATGQVTKPLYLADKTGAGKKGYSTVGDALTAVHEMAGKGFDVAVKAVSGTASGGKVTVKPGDTVTYAAGDNIALTQTGNTIALATSLTPVFGTVTVGKNGADGALSTLGPDGLRITAKGADGKTTDGPSILASGIDAGGRTIAHVAAGKAETDAANLGQMKDAVAAAANPLGSSVNNLGGSVAGMLGGGSTFDPKTGKLSEPAFMVHDTRYNNVSGAITALDGGISNLMKDALQWNPAIGAYDASHGGSGPQRITNVANGSEANDAVNLSQLNAVAVRANAGLNVTTTQTGTGMASGNGTGAVVKPGDTVTYTAGNNIALTQNGGSIAIATSLTPAFTSVTTGNAKLETNGLIIANGPSVTAAGIDAASRAIRNVADGVAPTDAVNLGQLTALTASANNLGNNANALGTSTASNLGGGAKYNPTTGEVSSPGYGVGGTQYSSVGNAIEALQASAPMQYSLPTSPTVGAPGSAPTNDVTLVGSAGKAPTLHNINAGEVSATSTDAINGSQLHGSAQSVATTLGGESTVSSTGQIVGTRYNVAGASYNNVGSAMSAIDRRFDSIGGDIASLQNQISSNYRKANGGIALALASSGLRYDDRPGKVSVAAAASVYHSQIGIAAGVGWTSEDHQWRANLAGTYSPSQQKPDIGVVGGLSYTFD